MVMNRPINITAVATLLCIGVLALSLLFAPACTDRLSGTQTPNQAPIIWFVNVPPDFTSTSTNLIVNWAGQDIDGQVVRYRYIVFREDTIANITGDTLPLDSMEVESFVSGTLVTMPDSIWTYLEVDPIAGDPKTSNIVPMSAQMDNPVNVFVCQFVFVQAFDELGASSKIIFRPFLRNDYPPDTRIRGFLGEPFINDTVAGAAITGVHMNWVGSDVFDYPTDPPPFEFEWRLYGPYFKNFVDTLVPTVWDSLVDDFIKEVFVTYDARIFECGYDLSFEDCDTSWEFDTTADPDTLIPVITCITIEIDTIQVNNIYGYRDTLFDVEDPAFVSDSRFNRIADSSYDTLDGDVWVTDLGASMYDVYSQEPSDTTREEYFIFWVRSRDDAKVPDISPPYQEFTVIDPKFERDIGVVDVQLSFSVNARIRDSARVYWERAIQLWADNAGITTNYTDSVDYIVVSCASGICISLRQMLAHNVLIVVNDNPYPGLLVNPDLGGDLFTAIDGGVNIWMCGRAQIFGGEGAPPNFYFFEYLPEWLSGLNQDPSTGYIHYFGVEDMMYSGWEWHIYNVPSLRIEDFVGATSLNEEKWPHLEIDTALLHRRYQWKGHFPWMDDIAALPEINWFVRAVGSQYMYIYRSKYGAKHFLNDPNFDYQGKPVGHRLNRGLFRTVHFLFTPYALEEVTMQRTVDNILDWLYDPGKSSTPASLRYNDADMPITVQEVRERYWQRMEERARQNPDVAKYFE